MLNRHACSSRAQTISRMSSWRRSIRSWPRLSASVTAAEDALQAAMIQLAEAEQVAAATASTGSGSTAGSSAAAIGSKRNSRPKATPASIPHKSPAAKQQQLATNAPVTCSTRFRRAAYSADKDYKNDRWHQESLQIDAKGIPIKASHLVLLMAVLPDKASADWIAVAKLGKVLDLKVLCDDHSHFYELVEVKSASSCLWTACAMSALTQSQSSSWQSLRKVLVLPCLECPTIGVMIEDPMSKQQADDLLATIES